VEITGIAENSKGKACNEEALPFLQNNTPFAA